MNLNPKEIGLRIKSLSDERGLSGLQLKKSIGHSVQYWIEGKGAPSGPRLRNLCAFFNVSPLYIIYGSEYEDLTSKSKSQGERLALARLNKGLTRNELGDAIGVKGMYIYDWETGLGSPDTGNFERLCLYFKKDLFYFKYGRGFLLSNLSVGERISVLRLNKGLSAYKMASQMGVAVGTLSTWENDNGGPTEQSIFKLSEFFGVSPCFILYGKELAQLLHEADSIASRIRFLRQDRCLNQTQLARHIKTTKQSVAFWEQGRGKPCGIRFRNLLSFFGVSPALIYYGQELDEFDLTCTPTHEAMTLFRNCHGITKRELSVLTGINEAYISGFELHSLGLSQKDRNRMFVFLNGYDRITYRTDLRKPIDSILRELFSLDENKRLAKELLLHFLEQ